MKTFKTSCYSLFAINILSSFLFFSFTFSSYGGDFNMHLSYITNMSYHFQLLQTWVDYITSSHEMHYFVTQVHTLFDFYEPVHILVYVVNSFVLANIFHFNSIFVLILWRMCWLLELQVSHYFPSSFGCYSIVFSLKTLWWEVDYSWKQSRSSFL